jgi:signal transduction histidine kinase
VTINRWWHTAVAVMLTACAVLLLWSAESEGRVVLGFGVIVAYALGWALLAPRAHEGNGAAMALIGLTIAATLVGCLATPNFAFFQCVAHPIAWVLSSSKRNGIIASSGVALAVGVGFVLGDPFSVSNLIASVLTAGMSLMFSIAFGLWISHIAELGEERQHLLDVLQATQAELVALSREAGVVAERERLARDIHDTVAQDLTGLVMLAEQAKRTADATARDALLAQVVDAARGALHETRALVAAGSPAALEGGLAAAIDRVAARFTRDTGITVTVTCRPASALDRDDEVVLLRCTQEALTNVRRHSGAATASVELDGTTLRVRDDGHGFDPESPTAGVGLAGMRERVTLAGGTFEVTSGEGGSTITVALPAGASAALSTTVERP